MSNGVVSVLMEGIEGPAEKKARITHVLQKLLGDKDKHLDDMQKHLDDKEKLVEKCENENHQLLKELSHLKAMYATRPLLEIGLQRFRAANVSLHSKTWTALSQEFLQSAVFKKDSTRLQAWASQKVRRMNAHFSWHIGADQELFAECLWNIWSQFSEKYHSLPGIDVGFVISGETEMQTAAATLFACALCGQELLDGLTVVSCWKDRRLWIMPDGKLLKSKPA